MAPSSRQQRKERWACVNCKWQGGGGTAPYLNPWHLNTCQSCYRPKAQVCSPTTTLAERQLDAQKRDTRLRNNQAKGKGKGGDKQPQPSALAQLQKEKAKLQEDLAKARSELEKANAATQVSGVAEATNDTQDLSAENKAKLKELEQYRKWLLNLDEPGKKWVCLKEGITFEEKLGKLADDRNAILAQNRSLQPVKVQHAKTDRYVSQLALELERAKKAQDDLLATYYEMSADIAKKEQNLESKKAELAALAERVAAEDAVQPKTESDRKNARPEVQITGVSEDVRKDAATVFQSLIQALGNSNVKEVLAAQGANNLDFAKLEQTVQLLGGALAPGEKT